MFKLDPLTAKKLKRFRQIKRGYYSFLILCGLVALTLVAELWVNNKAVMVSYEGKLYFPTYTGVKLGSVFGLDGVEGQKPVNYRDLKARFAEADEGNWVWMPIIPYSPQENISYEGAFKPAPPSLERMTLLGTDSTGRDILARLVYGFRVAVFFALGFVSLVFLIGITLGCLMGYFGGIFDLLVQRIIEIWSNIPFIYTVIIIFSVVPSSIPVTPRILILLTVMVLFSWPPMTYYMRTATYREKARDYAAAAKVLGASTGRTIFHHILPNTLATIITFIPFTMASAITAVTALDFLGFGLPPPTPSMGELLRQGTGNLNAPWIVAAAFNALVYLLLLVTFVGEAVREAFDPKKHTFYE